MRDAQLLRIVRRLRAEGWISRSSPPAQSALSEAGANGGLALGVARTEMRSPFACAAWPDEILRIALV